jgi:hypothetical protein
MASREGGKRHKKVPPQIGLELGPSESTRKRGAREDMEVPPKKRVRGPALEGDEEEEG